MSDPSDRLINLLGALATGVADRVRGAALDGTTFGGETAAALVVVGHTPGLSINQLGRVLRLSHPGTVRLVDRLANAGHVARSLAPHDGPVANPQRLPRVDHTARMVPPVPEATP